MKNGYTYLYSKKSEWSTLAAANQDVQIEIYLPGRGRSSELPEVW
jgi:hypothetical protein